MSNQAYLDLITAGVSVPLSILASGYSPQGLIYERVFPRVKSVLRTGQIPIFGKDAFKRYETVRARGAHSNRAQMTPDSWITFACTEHDLAIPLDQLELEELANIPGDRQLNALFDLENRQRRRVQWNMALELEGTIADTVQNSANYAAAHVTSLSGSNCFSETGSTPVTYIEAAREIIRQDIGVYPNTMVMGAEAYSTLKFHAQYTDKMKLTMDKVVMPSLIAQMHDLKEVIIGMSMGIDADGNFVDLWGDNILLFYKPETTTPTVDEPSFGYVIVPAFSSKPFPYIDIFPEEGGKIINVRCTDMYTEKFIMANAGYLIKNVKK
jgi:hypothetical protein